MGSGSVWGFLRPMCLILSLLAAVAGGMGMAVSFLVLGSTNTNEVVAGAAGFVAGSVLLGAGLLSLTLLAKQERRTKQGEAPSQSGEVTRQSGFQQKR